MAKKASSPDPGKGEEKKGSEKEAAPKARKTTKAKASEPKAAEPKVKAEASAAKSPKRAKAKAPAAEASVAKPTAAQPAARSRVVEKRAPEKRETFRAGSQAPKRETKTTLVKAEAVDQKWFLFDAKGKTLGRLATEIAKVLIGKHKPSYTPNIDMGDGVIVINADAVKVTGLKEARKVYRYYTGYMGGQREYIYRDMKAKKPTYMLWHAVRGMMPKSRLGKQQMRKLRLFATGEHPHQAQQPIKVEI